MVIFMTEQKFESAFHKRYVGGEGVIEERPLASMGPKNELPVVTYEDILEEYRRYIGDSKAELPAEVLEELVKLGKI